ncbi:Zinc finger, RING-CH-type [Sesbania bispinosa]|nr:Zinc finger, RING-CH-type [Sesbania bispinosa]
MGKENVSPMAKEEVSDDGSSSVETGDLESHPRLSLEKETGLASCRVCQCAESDKRGDAALEFLGITPVIESDGKGVQKDMSLHKNIENKSGVVEFVGPDGEVFICKNDLEIGLSHQDALLELGCCCKNDLALVHYACALKWFVNHGSTICEICGHIANNIRVSDFNKVVGSLKEYEALRERTATGDPGPAQANANNGVDPDAVAAIRRQRLSEIALWFCPHNSSNITNNSNVDTVSLVVSEQPLNIVPEDAGPEQNPATKWAVEGTGILLATGLLTITLAWLIAPRVGKLRKSMSLVFEMQGGLDSFGTIFCELCGALDMRLYSKRLEQFRMVNHKFVRLEHNACMFKGDSGPETWLVVYAFLLQKSYHFGWEK